MIPDAVRNWLKENGYGEVSASRPVGGGCINHGVVLETSCGQSCFLKTNHHAPADMFAREAEGLEILRVDGGPAVPQPYLAGPDFLLMEDLAPASPRPGYWQLFGHQLAAMHLHTGARFGLDHDNYIGSTPQPNPRMEDGYAFFAEARLNFQADLARRRGLLAAQEAKQVERLAARLPELIPSQPAGLLHGDLWSGNITADASGNPAIIDPAAHYGWAEAELAMTDLFGSLPGDFYDAYTEARPLERGYRQRFPIYNLYHLLNHLNLFGRGYYGQVMAVVRKFA